MGRKILILLFFVSLVALCASFGALFMPGEWYAQLVKPSWNPPASVFGPVWTTLYIMIAVAGFLAWESGHGDRGRALTFWGVQLVLNAAWSWLFFGLHRPGWAFGEILLLLAAIVITIRAFYRIKPVAALLMVPYLAWVSFASFLNFTIWRLNGGGLGSIFG